MVVRTCLLISDDPDDHIEFSEALYDISDDTVLISVADMKKSADLLALRRCIPEYIFLNLGMSELDVDLLFATLESSELAQVQVVAYGDRLDILPSEDKRIAHYLDSEITFSELKKQLKKLLK